MQNNRQVKDLVQDIVRRILSAYEPDKIILFGSHARGMPDKHSDLDLLVVMDTRLPAFERDIRVRQSIGPLDLPVDVFVLTPEEFEETKDVIGGLAYAPAKYGSVVYEKS